MLKKLTTFEFDGNLRGLLSHYKTRFLRQYILQLTSVHTKTTLCYFNGLLFQCSTISGILLASVLEIYSDRRQVLNCDGCCRYLAHLRKFITYRFNFLKKHSSNLPNTTGEDRSVVYDFGHIGCVIYNVMNEYANNCKSSCKGNAHYMWNVVSVCFGENFTSPIDGGGCSFVYFYFNSFIWLVYSICMQYAQHTMLYCIVYSVHYSILQSSFN